MLSYERIFTDVFFFLSSSSLRGEIKSFILLNQSIETIVINYYYQVALLVVVILLHSSNPTT